MKLRTLGLVTLALVSVSAVASAHIALKSPTARTTDQIQLKTGPCGQTTNARTANVTVFKPGQTITVAWDETINHPGHYRISFDPNGTNFPNPKSFTDMDGGVNVLVDGIPDKTGAAPIAYSQQVTLPNVECNNCTLQLIQVMTDKPPYDPGPTGNDIYYQCADLVLTNSDAGLPPPPDGGSTTDAGTTTDSGSSVDSGSSSPDAGTNLPSNDPGCSCETGAGTTTGGASLAGAVVVVLALALARRRSQAVTCSRSDEA